VRIQGRSLREIAALGVWALHTRRVAAGGHLRRVVGGRSARTTAGGCGAQAHNAGWLTFGNPDGFSAALDIIVDSAMDLPALTYNQVRYRGTRDDQD